MTHDPSQWLRRVLLVDAATSGAMGLLLVVAANLLAPLLGLPAALLDYAGLSLIPFAALVCWVATRQQLPRPGVWAIIACNAVWSADSILLLLSGYVAPTGLGATFVVAQALVVAILAELEYVGLRRTAASMA
ncbi:MAG: hypothetical protein ABSG76_21070 [Xanthobacteraceae bacterium]|jgi:hypothetical protein